MGFFTRRKPEPVPAASLGERLNGAMATRSAALSFFDLIVDDLEEACNEALEVEALALAEAERLTEFAIDAHDVAADAYIKARSIAGVLGR